MYAGALVGAARDGEKMTDLKIIETLTNWSRLSMKERTIADITGFTKLDIKIRTQILKGNFKVFTPAGIEYRLFPEKINVHTKSSGRWDPKKSYFLENMSTEDVNKLTMEVMNKLSSDDWKDILKSNGQGIVKHIGKEVGYTQSVEH